MSPVSHAVNPPAAQAVYIRRSAPINGETSGWAFDPNLRCQSVNIRAGLGLGRAALSYVSLNLKPPAIEDVVARYHPDDQVRVELFPPDGPTGLDTSAEGTGLVVFEGPLTRMPLSVVSQNATEDESADFVATAMPFIDQWSREHLVSGRWYHKQLADPQPDPLPHFSVVESRAVPAAFNHRGRANMDADDTHKRSAFGGAALTARGFTHDNDPAGRYWTTGAALKSLVVEWLYGSGDPGRNRSTGVESDTLVALEAFSEAAPGSITDNRFKGLGDILPETDVTGMPLFTAINAVCRAGGFEWSVEPDMQLTDATADRLYLIRIWRRHAGYASGLSLPKRGTFPASPGETLRRADVNRLHIQRDNAGIINDVIARGRVDLELTIELKPLWSPTDIDTAPVTATHQLPPGPAATADTYHQKHVQGGTSFATHGHVGRLWGIDCTGASATQFYQDGTPQAPGPYDHDAKGFDWLTTFGIDGTDPMSLERVAAGDTTPIDWTRRVRMPSPLTRDTARLRGQRYVLEVSEDGASNWIDISDRVSFTTLTDFFGIQLNSIPNLAVVNADALTTGQPPAIADSWWQKMLDQKLSFRLTANVPADHESVALSASDGTSGSLYNRGALIYVDTAEVWSSPKSTLNAGSTWVKIPAANGNASLGGDLSGAVQSQADRLRDKHEGTIWSVSCDTFLLQPWKFKIGDRIRGIAGRGLSFATNSGAEERHPAVVEIDMTLAGPGGDGSAQGMSLSLTDTAQRGGV